MRHRAIVAALVLASLGCEAPVEQPGQDTPPPGQALPADQLHVPVTLTARQEQGRLVYETLCWTCHGQAGRGDGPAVEAGSIPAPPDLHSPGIASLSAEDLEARFIDAMAGEPDPRHHHMRFIATLITADRFRDALAYVPALTYPAEIQGSAMAGRELYQDYCLGCHGPSGTGDGPAAELLAVSPVDFPVDTLIADRDWQGVFQRIKQGAEGVHGSSMPPWGVVLDDGQIWDLVSFVATFQPDVLSEAPGLGP